jgi:inosose dehydratase
MTGTWRVAFNPLPFFATPHGFDRDAAPPLNQIYQEISDAGFSSVHVEVPDGMSVGAYRAMLADRGLAPAPGYFQHPFSENATMGMAAQAAARAAGQHAELGLTRIFLADQVGPPARVAVPAVGAGYDSGRLDTIIENVARAADVMVAEGVTPCLHQHVGTWIETAAETETVLASISPASLMLGPDTGHLAWAGASPAEFISRHLDRVGAVHLKDVRHRAISAAQQRGATYREATELHVFTEPGRGDVDLAAVLAVLSGFTGWLVIEVDVPDQPTAFETARVSAEWASDRLTRGGTASA